MPGADHPHQTGLGSKGHKWKSARCHLHIPHRGICVYITTFSCRFDAFLDLMANVTQQTQYVSVTYFSDNALDREISRSVTVDIYLIIISVAIYISLAIAFLSR